ncbi:MAG: C_GCAxxG_C_C family protein [Brevinematales bacterium]|nr:C_GCAxxG_C_C family protein [Brevinematales bacterium]
MGNSETAVNQFKEGYNCAQSVFFSFADRLQIPADTALRLATGFGAGMGRMQEVCGAVSGGILVLGMLYGRGENDGRPQQDITYAKVREFMDKFSAKHGTVNCKSLLDGCELLTPEGQTRFKSEGMADRCREYVGSAAQVIEAMIEENTRQL